MKKFFLTILFLGNLLAANAQDNAETNLYDDNFSYLAPYSTKGVIKEGATGSFYDAIQQNTSTPAVYALDEISVEGVTAAEAMENKGYTLLYAHRSTVADQSAAHNIYLQIEEALESRAGEEDDADKAAGAYLKFGKSNYQAGLQFPPLDKCGTGSVKNVKVSFEWCPVKQGNGNFDKPNLVLFVNDDYENSKKDVPQHTFVNGTDPLAWVPAEVDFGDYALKNGDRITLRNRNEDWGTVTAHRYYLRNVKVSTSDNITTGVEEIEADANAPVEYYNLQGVRVSEPVKGCYIVRSGSKVSKKFICK
ncbi:MAG: hypothetical protein K2K97_02280 [Muribaculaceae bacterium]|nr:hypothetical protein [Muribaculaceae bacterium]